MTPQPYCLLKSAMYYCGEKGLCCAVCDEAEHCRKVCYNAPERCGYCLRYLISEEGELRNGG